MICPIIYLAVKVSHGAISNMLKRSHHPFAIKKDNIIQICVRRNGCSDETGIRIEGVNGSHWVFICYLAIMHEIQISLAKQVVLDMMGKHTPKLFLSDGYAVGQGHGEHHQTCLAHLARDIAYGVEASTDMLPVRLKVWMEKVFHLAHNLKNYTPSTIKTKRRQLDKVLSDILASRPECKIV